MDARNLPGPLKVAILIQALDQGAAQRVIGGLSDKERKLIHGHLNQMGPVAPVLIEKVAREFAQVWQQYSSPGWYVQLSDGTWKQK